MHAKSSAVRYIPLYKISSSRAETDLSPCRCSQDPGLPSKGHGTLAEWLCCGVRAGPEISEQSNAVTQPTESFQSQNHLRTITFRFGTDVYMRTTHRHIPRVVSHLGTSAQMGAQLDSKCEFAFFMWTQAS